jgi:hypothetical protein
MYSTNNIAPHPEPAYFVKPTPPMSKCAQFVPYSTNFSKNAAPIDPPGAH